VPAITGPTTLDSAGAKPSQLKMRVSAARSPSASRPAERWIAISPTLAPTPHNEAATHINGNCQATSQVAMTATKPPAIVTPTARRIG
jgi:hypothetical protein